MSLKLVGGVFCIAALSDGWSALLGVPLSELQGVELGGIIQRFVHPDDIEPTAAKAGELLKPGATAVSFRNRYNTPRGYRVLTWQAFSGGDMLHAIATVEP